MAWGQKAVREQQPPTTFHFLGVGGGSGRGAAGRGRWGGDHTSVGGGPVVLGHEGGSSTRAEGSEVERVDKMWRTPGYA